MFLIWMSQSASMKTCMIPTSTNQTLSLDLKCERPKKASISENGAKFFYDYTWVIALISTELIAVEVNVKISRSFLTSDIVTVYIDLISFLVKAGCPSSTDIQASELLWPPMFLIRIFMKCLGLYSHHKNEQNICQLTSFLLLVMFL